MKNELKWENGENDGFPMKLVEKGLDFSGKTAFFFYFSGLVAILSMIWVMVLSIKLIHMTSLDPNIPEYYKMLAFVCLAIGAASLYSFYKIYMDRRAYRKEIEINNGIVKYHEVTRKQETSWQEKLKKYQGVNLKHYSYRGVDSWYVALIHSDSSKSFPVFAPDYDSRMAKEDEKRKLLAQYGSKLNLLTTYERPEKTTSRKTLNGKQ
jgi:hypothetical protein